MSVVEEFQDRLRAILADRTGREIPVDMPVTIEAYGPLHGTESRGLQICPVADTMAEDGLVVEYEEDCSLPDPFERICADMLKMGNS